MKLRTAILIVLAATLAAVHASNGGTNTLLITGSNVFGEKLGPLLIQGFARKAPKIDVVLKRPGSGEGLAALIAGNTDIAPTSRPANKRELAAAKAAGLELRSQAIGSYGVTILVNKANPLTSLKPAQVRNIFTGKITDWKQVGGPAGPIKVFILDKNTGARAGFQGLAMRGSAYADSAIPCRNYDAIEAAVAGDPSAIGYTDMGQPAAGAKGLLINGQPPNAAAVFEGLYPFANTIFFYTVAERKAPAAGRFTRFVLSREGQRILQKAGYAPHSSEPSMPVPAP